MYRNRSACTDENYVCKNVVTNVISVDILTLKNLVLIYTYIV